MQTGRREGDLRQVFRDACRRADLVAEEQRLEAEHVVRLAVLFVEGVGGGRNTSHEDTEYVAWSVI